MKKRPHGSLGSGVPGPDRTHDGASRRRCNVIHVAPPTSFRRSYGGRNPAQRGFRVAEDDRSRLEKGGRVQSIRRDRAASCRCLASKRKLKRRSPKMGRLRAARHPCILRPGGASWRMRWRSGAAEAGGTACGASSDSDVAGVGSDRLERRQARRPRRKGRGVMRSRLQK